MKNRSTFGGTLAVVISTTLIIGIIGVAVFFLIRIFGGGRELQHATDSGNLNVAKEAIVNPGVALDTATNPIEGAFAAYATNNGEINLTNYNQLVGQALLVALNAQSDGSSSATTNAQNLINALHGTAATSIGTRLKNALSDKNNANLVGSFHNTAVNNSIRMLGGNSTLSGDANAYKVAYLEQRVADTGATNLALNGSVFESNTGTGVAYSPDGNTSIYAKALPYNFDNHTIVGLPGNARTAYSGTDYLRGYQPLNIGGMTIYGVPLQPTQQPHLVSLTTFDQSVNQPGNGAASLPPNTFRNGALATEEKSGSNASTISAAIVGALNNTFQPRIKHGYILIDNSGGTSYNGNAPSTNNVAASEFTNGGIEANPSTKAFTRNNSLKNLLQNTARPLSASQEQSVQNALNSSNLDDNLFNSNGSKITDVTQAENAIPYQSSTVNCNHFNSGGSTAISPCDELLGSGGFDNAYHGGGQYGAASTGGMLMAIEKTKCEVFGAFSNGGPNCENITADNTTTGLRAYGAGHNPILGQDAAYRPGVFPAAASDPSVTCKVSSDGNLQALVAQTTAGSYVRKVNGGASPGSETPMAEFTRFITTCILQMKPNATAADFDRVLGNSAPPIVMNRQYYVHLDNNDNVVIQDASSSTAPGLQDFPPSFWPTARVADGKKYEYSATYEGYESIFDSSKDNNIHDHLFMIVNNTSPNGVMGTDTVSFQKASGAFNLLGVVKFTNQASGSAQLCDRN